MNPENEKRRAQRVQVRLEMKHDLKVEVAQGICKNISAVGLYMETVQKLPAGAACELVIHLGDSRYYPVIRVAGRVVRVDEAGMGIEFVSIDLQSYEHLKNIIIFSSSDPERAEEEFKKYLGFKLR